MPATLVINARDELTSVPKTYEDERRKLLTITSLMTHDTKRNIVFGTEEDMTRLCASTVVAMDGTFKVCPRMFYQLFIIHSFPSSLTGSLPELLKKCPSWDMSLQTQLRGVKILSIMRVSIMGLNQAK